MQKVRLKSELGDDSADNRDGRGWVRNTLPATVRDIAAETRSLRLLHPPDLRTPAQKRKDVDAFITGSASAASIAAAALEAAAAPERIAAREQACAALGSLAAAAAGSGSADWNIYQGVSSNVDGGLAALGAEAKTPAELSASEGVVGSSLESGRPASLAPR